MDEIIIKVWQWDFKTILPCRSNRFHQIGKYVKSTILRSAKIIYFTAATKFLPSKIEFGILQEELCLLGDRKIKM